jgi:hypothetical protein
MRKNEKKNEIDPLPFIPAIPAIPPDFLPKKIVEISGEPKPEIIPSINPEIDHSKKEY